MSTILTNIKVDIPYEQIYRRLGYLKSTTSINDTQKEKIDIAIKKSFLLCNLTACFQKYSIKEKNDNFVIFYNEIRWKSNDLLRFLADINEIYLIGITAGKEIVDYRDKLIKEDAFISIIADAVGSETVEKGANYLHNLIGKMIIKEGKHTVKRRYSPGYGDFLLENQSDFYKLLELQKIGVELTSNFILMPEKSITAIIGII
ncbi:MAG: hypothetical protein A2086_15370 [Spirochaetes bacterium GWD1_27_9]|nr:MAG: hypothetical protein A2Z98_04395 [Spirochaetes bacterium GWB1_27_13]OHD27231.1 MAG: hypothetical protein A2Y34_17110 [Spirochaetes bacterium GWC1_27_15]OHD39590.1 MAG: hypothetical protein A2086_15370 [Spirochaetes bacterium GWD1_27_9]